MSDYSPLDGIEDPTKKSLNAPFDAYLARALNPDTIDIEGIGEVRVSDLSLVGVAVLYDGGIMRFEVILGGVCRPCRTTQDGYLSLLTAMRGRP